MKDLKNKQQGGQYNKEIANSRSFISSWLSKRENQLSDNMGGGSPFDTRNEMFRQIENMYDTSVAYDFYDHANKSVGLDKAEKRMYEASNEDYGKRLNEVKELLKERDRFIDIQKNDLNYNGVFRPKFKSIHVKDYLNSSDRKSTLIHEHTHSLSGDSFDKYPIPQLEAIDKIIKNKKDSYLDSPTEIYSRMMQFRYHNKLDPNKEYTKDQINEMRDNQNSWFGPEIKDFQLINRYSNDELLELFNNIASNKTEKLNHSKKGGEMIKRKDGSYSKRGLWDNIRDNKGSGKKPTKEMLEQERKIKSKKQEGGNFFDNGMSGAVTGVSDNTYPELKRGVRPMYTDKGGRFVGIPKEDVDPRAIAGRLAYLESGMEGNKLPQFTSEDFTNSIERMRYRSILGQSNYIPNPDNVQRSKERSDVSAYYKDGGNAYPSFENTGIKRVVDSSIGNSMQRGGEKIIQGPERDFEGYINSHPVYGESDDMIRDFNALRNTTLNMGSQLVEGVDIYKDQGLEEYQAPQLPAWMNSRTSMNVLTGMGMVSDRLTRRDREAQFNSELIRTGNSDNKFQTSNPRNPFGNYTLNVGPGQNFQPNMNNYAQTMKQGGEYQDGGEYEVTEDELQQMIRDGYDIEIL